jgi:hypothetical protein
VGVWVDGWLKPITNTTHGTDIRMRMWSTGKPPTAIAVLQAAGVRIDPRFTGWMQGAIERSENCPWREMVLYLQALKGPLAKTATERFDAVFQTAGATGVRTIGTLEPPDSGACTGATYKDWPYPLTDSAPQLGVTTWHIEDAVRFAHALGTRQYRSSGDTVLHAMREPKHPSRELDDPATEYTANPNWGAGVVFKGWDPAYKSGWGGQRHGDFMLAQYIVLNVHGHIVAIAAAFHPLHQPTSDDPGQHGATLGIESMLTPIRRAIEKLYGRSG